LIILKFDTLMHYGSLENLLYIKSISKLDIAITPPLIVHFAKIWYRVWTRDRCYTTKCSRSKVQWSRDVM